MPPRMLPTATPRLPDSDALATMAISGRLVAIANRMSPPSADPRWRRVDNTSVWSDSAMPAIQIAAAAAMKAAANAHTGRFDTRAPFTTARASDAPTDHPRLPGGGGADTGRV